MASRDLRPDLLEDHLDRPDHQPDLVRRVIAGDAAAAEAVLAVASTSVDLGLLVVAAAESGDRAYLDRATGCARGARDRQLVALTDAFLRGDRELFDVLVREHLAAYPDHLLAAWLAAEQSARPRPLNTDSIKEQP